MPKEREVVSWAKTKAANEHMHKAAAGRTKHTLFPSTSRELVFPALRILFSLNLINVPDGTFDLRPLPSEHRSLIWQQNRESCLVS